MLLFSIIAVFHSRRFNWRLYIHAVNITRFNSNVYLYFKSLIMHYKHSDNYIIVINNQQVHVQYKVFLSVFIILGDNNTMMIFRLR